jgi:hypothetical protein
MQPIIEVYAKLIAAGVKLLADVPKHLQDDVQELLNKRNESL